MTLLKKFIKELYSICCYSDFKTSIKYFICIILNLPQILKDKKLIAADKEMHNTMCKFKVYSNKILLFKGEYFGGLREICCRKVYFKSPDFDIQENDTVVDLGANVGVFTTVAALCGKRVISVEAQSNFLPIIESNLKMNTCLEKASIIFGIIGPGSGLLSKESNQQSASHWDKTPPIISMENIIKENKIKEIDFLKIDIEGSEFDLFSKNTEWLSIVKKIVLEVHLEFGDLNDLLTILKNAGFDFVLVDNDQNIVSNFKSSGGYIFARKSS